MPNNQDPLVLEVVVRQSGLQHSHRGVYVGGIVRSDQDGLVGRLEEAYAIADHKYRQSRSKPGPACQVYLEARAPGTPTNVYTRQWLDRDDDDTGVERWLNETMEWLHAVRDGDAMLPFREYDWANYAGAEYASNGLSPRIGHVERDGWPIAVVADATGVDVDMGYADTEGMQPLGYYSLRLGVATSPDPTKAQVRRSPAVLEMARAIGEVLLARPHMLRPDWLLSAGFKELEHPVHTPTD